MPFLYLSYKRRPSWNLKKKKKQADGHLPGIWSLGWYLSEKAIKLLLPNKGHQQYGACHRTIIQCAGKFTTVHRIVFTMNMSHTVTLLVRVSAAISEKQP